MYLVWGYGESLSQLLIAAQGLVYLHNCIYYQKARAMLHKQEFWNPRLGTVMMDSSVSPIFF